jgi:hypothetical protein
MGPSKNASGVKCFAPRRADSEKVISSFNAPENFQNGIFALPICWRAA